MIILKTFCYILMVLYMFAWTSLLWELTGYKQLTFWYWIAYFGGATV